MTDVSLFVSLQNEERLFHTSNSEPSLFQGCENQKPNLSDQQRHQKAAEPSPSARELRWGSSGLTARVLGHQLKNTVQCPHCRKGSMC